MKKNEAKRWIAPIVVVLALLLTVGGLVAYGAGFFDRVDSPTVERPTAPPAAPATSAAPRRTPGVCPVTGMTSDAFPKGAMVPLAPAAATAPDGCCPDGDEAGDMTDCDHDAPVAGDCDHAE